MAYSLVYAPSAIEDLEALVDSLPDERRRRSIAEIDRMLTEFAAKPLFVRHPFASPTISLTFLAEGVRHYWAATFEISEDEQQIQINHVFRLAM
jgi:hypothetical protein